MIQSDIAASPIAWHLPSQSGVTFEVDLKLHKKKSPLPHQHEAINDVFAGFAENDRGKLIMACGTGKTFTSLKIAERLQSERAPRPASSPKPSTPTSTATPAWTTTTPSTLSKPPASSWCAPAPTFTREPHMTRRKSLTSMLGAAMDAAALEVAMVAMVLPRS